MLVKRVTSVTLTRSIKTSGAATTDYGGTPLWRVEWTEIRSGTTTSWGHSHHTEIAARRHIAGLLGQVDPALENVYVEIV